ncbi:MAG: TonB-dependent receptor, partial [Flavisolibacter sp.]|nr:TonB-dependent receptor [Flavisolibacter sp.]
MKRWVVVMASFCLVATANAQSILKGIVTQDGKPVQGATVLFNKDHRLTDTTGQFSFSGLTPGKYTLHVTMVGSEAYHKQVTLDKEEVKELIIQLQPVSPSLDAVVVTGTLKPVKKSQSPIPVEVYSPQFFKKNPAPSIFESLQNVNGVRPQINCSVCNTGDIHINGLEGPYTMVTIDGMPIVSSLSSVYGLFGIPSEMIDRVEIVKGPASGLYGSEAIGGLINIITKSPQQAPAFSASVMSTSWNEHTVDLGVKWKLKEKLQSLLGINYFNYNQPFDRNDDGFTDVTLQHRISVFNKWNLERKYNRAASLAGRYFHENRWGGDTRWNKQFRGTDSIYGESIYTRRWELIGNYQLPLMQQMSFSFSATGHDQNSYYGTTSYMADQKIMFGQLLWNLPEWKDHEILLGLTSRFNYYDDNSTATIDTLTKQNHPEKYFIPGIFVQDEWKMSYAHTLLGGIRFDHHPAHGSIFTPRLAYKWAIDDKRIFRLNAGTGFRVVNLFTEDHAALTGARVVEIKEKLRPEKSYNINLNYSHQFGTPSKAFGIDASAWYSYFRNQIIADYDTDPARIIYDNLKGNAVSRGVTVNLEANIMKRLKALAGTTVQDVSKVEKISGTKTKQRPMLTERWSGTWLISYSWPASGITVDYTGNIYGPMRLPLLSHLDPRKEYSPVW